MMLLVLTSNRERCRSEGELRVPLGHCQAEHSILPEDLQEGKADGKKMKIKTKTKQKTKKKIKLNETEEE